MPIYATRLQQDIEAIAGGTLGSGANRPTFSDSWRRARDFVIEQVEQVGGHVRIDPAGNVHARPVGMTWSDRVWLSGSHLDSVPDGGDFDGVLGVVCPLEAMRAAHEDTHQPLPLELVIFAEEEGTTFGMGMLGSRTWAGTLGVQELSKVRNRQGQNYLEAGAAHGVVPDKLAIERMQPNAYVGMIELHIEQGPGMWKRGESIALVTAINGRRQYLANVGGLANHAGATSMDDRNDALAGAAEMMVAIESLPKAIAPQAVATVGRIECSPNAVNVIPSQVRFTVDFRAPTDEWLAAGDQSLRERTSEIAKRRGLFLHLEETDSLPAVGLSPDACSCLRRAAANLKIALPETVSGALHDTAILAPFIPAAMLFVASKHGISHNPAEFSRIDDIVLAARILYAAVSGGEPQAA
jgi:allantoate deiminase